MVWQPAKSWDNIIWLSIYFICPYSCILILYLSGIKYFILRHRLTNLVVIACLAMFGIICMQGYWLAKFYKEKKARLLADVESVLIEAHVQNGTSAEIGMIVNELSAGLLKGLSTSDPKDRQNIVLLPDGGDVSDSIVMGMARDLLKSSVRDTLKREFTLDAYKEQLQNFLLAKEQKFPIELALFDNNRHYLLCTTDTFSFEQISTKSGLALSLPIRLNKKYSGRMQVAVPRANFVVIKQMGAVMILSLLLLVGSTTSLILMVVIFYRQKRVTEIRNDFMNNMTHELKTPISSVSLALELLQDQSVTMDEEEKREYFKVANNELNRLTLLVDKVLKMAAFEKSEVSVHFERFPVKPWLESIVSSFKPKMDTANVQMAVTIFPDSMYIRADKIHMTNVMQNLIENAIKYGDKNKEDISVQINAWESEEESFISVKDNGKGIPDAYIAKVFDKFFRVPTGDEHETKGYGLGLSYVQEIIRLHEGEITVESTNRIGTRFKLHVPKK